jgi:hypothetical protein
MSVGIAPPNLAGVCPGTLACLGDLVVGLVARELALEGEALEVAAFLSAFSRSLVAKDELDYTTYNTVDETIK